MDLSVDAGTDEGPPTAEGTSSDAGIPSTGDLGCDPLRTYDGELDTQPDSNRYGSSGPVDTKLEVLRGVSVITGLVRLAGPSITDLSALSCVTRITAFRPEVPPVHETLIDTRYGLELIGTSLTSLHGLERLTSVGGLRIENNAGLHSLQGLERLADARALNVSSNANLESLAGLEGLTSVGEPGLDEGRLFSVLTIYGNGALRNLQGLQNLTRVDGRFELRDNRALTSLQGLNGLQSVDALRIEFNAALPNCQALSLRDRIGIENIPGGISISDNNGTGDCQ